MQFKIGDKVVMTAARDRNCRTDWDKKGYEGIEGVIQEIRFDKGFWHGPYCVNDGVGGWSYCTEEEIRHLDAPAIPYDKPVMKPRDTWMQTRQWKRVVRSS